jgi:hypothetical protein
MAAISVSSKQSWKTEKQAERVMQGPPSFLESIAVAAPTGSEMFGLLTNDRRTWRSMIIKVWDFIRYGILKGQWSAMMK